MQSHRNKMCLIALVALAMPIEKLFAISCTIENKSRATLVVKFHILKWFRTATSDQITVLPGEKKLWETGDFLKSPYPIEGIHIISMTLDGKPVPGAAGVNQNWPGLKAKELSEKWVMTESFVDPEKTKIQFTLVLNPAGPKFTNEKGKIKLIRKNPPETIWKSEPLQIKG